MRREPRLSNATIFRRCVELIRRIRDDMDKYPEMRKYMGGELASISSGEAGILLLQWKLAPSEDVARQLYDHLEAR